MDKLGFWKDERGTFAPTLAVALLAILGCAGAAADYSHAKRLHSKAVQAIDTGILASIDAFRNGITIEEAETIGENLIAANLGGSDWPFELPQINLTTDDTNIKATTNYDFQYPTALIQVVGVDYVNMNVFSQAKASVVREEITLVLDTSDSMRLNMRIERLKDAATSSANQINPFNDNGSYRVVNLVPFGNTVNFGTARTDWLAPNSSSNKWSTFQGCFEVVENDIGKFDMADVTLDDEGNYGDLNIAKHATASKRKVPYCQQPEKTKAEFGIDNKEDLIDRIEGLELTWGTGTDDAITWGVRSLHPEWKGVINNSTKFPAPFAEGNDKFLVLLTDGRVARFRWNGKKYSKVSGNGGLNSFIDTCEAIEDETDITVFTIGFDLTSASNSTRKALQECASDDGRYFDASTDNIDEVFDAIYDQIRSLRLSS